MRHFNMEDMSMCGIVGYTGKRDAKKIILNGLYRLEYRGYDSAGMSLFNEQTSRYELYKDAGRVDRLAQIVEDVPPSNSGIGHTRWATHGKVNQMNAHPHMSKNNRFTIVHNGVIENYQSLQKKYLNNHQFSSETDTEVIVALIDHFSTTMPVQKAILKTLKLLKGSYALLILDQDEPTKMYAAKHKSPLLVGQGKDDFIVASDLMAMVGICDAFIALEDETFVVIEAQKIILYNLDHEPQTIHFHTLDYTDELADKGTHPHYMIKEIMEQPIIIRRILEKYYPTNQLELNQDLINDINDADRIYILAAGTSMHAGYVGRSIIEKMVNKPVEVHIASEFAYHLPVLSKKPFFMLISQSGETADLVACLKRIRPINAKTLTITNVKTSTLGREADYTLEIFAGPEIAVASTKAYTAQIAVLTLLAYALSGNQTWDIHYEYSKLSQAMESFLEHYEEMHHITKDTFTKFHAFYIGRGIDYYVGLEAALKLKEISYIHTEGYAAGELKHGTIALIEDKTPVIGLITTPEVALNTRSNLHEVASRGANTLTIVTESLKQEGDNVVLPDVHPYLTPILTVLPTQLFAYYAALERGLDIDKPRNLAKSVTVE